jgi:hypothetical protein
MRGADWRKRVVSRLMATTNRREKILQSSRVRARQRRLIAGVLIWQRIVSRQWGWGTCPVWVKLDRVGRGYTSFHVRNPPTATVMAGCPVPIPHLAAEAATLGSPLPCAPLDVGAISVCIAARPPNFRREKDLLHFLCIGLFVFNSEILRGNARRGNAPPRRQGFIPPYPYGGRCGVSEDFRLSDSKTIPFGRARYPPPVGPEIKHLLPFIAAMYCAPRVR